MAVNAVDEALRNLTAVGGDITHAAILDNFCWGNSTDPQQLGMLVRAVKGCYDAVLGFGTPFISGKDSLNNEYRADGKRLPVIPTLVISAVGRIDDAAQTVDMSLKTPGNLLYLIGATRNELAGSYYAEIVDQSSFAMLLPHTSVPHVDIPRAYTTMKTLGRPFVTDWCVRAMILGGRIGPLGCRNVAGKLTGSYSRPAAYFDRKTFSSTTIRRS